MQEAALRDAQSLRGAGPTMTLMTLMATQMHNPKGGRPNNDIDDIDGDPNAQSILRGQAQQ